MDQKGAFLKRIQQKSTRNRLVRYPAFLWAPRVCSALSACVEVECDQKVGVSFGRGELLFVVKKEQIIS